MKLFQSVIVPSPYFVIIVDRQGNKRSELSISHLDDVVNRVSEAGDNSKAVIIF